MKGCMLVVIDKLNLGLKGGWTVKHFCFIVKGGRVGVGEAGTRKYVPFVENSNKDTLSEQYFII